MGTAIAEPSPANPTSSRLRWLDRLKGIALIWIFLNHAVEHILGSAAFGNPFPGWPPPGELFRQLAPLGGHGIWNVPLNLFRYVGWLGDQAVGLFLVLSGFGLAWGILTARESASPRWKDFYARRLFRMYPLWWAVHGIVLVGAVLGLLSQPLSVTRFLLSLVGLRVDPDTFYAFSAAWWFVGLLLQFYLLFPFLWVLANRWGGVRLLLVSMLIALAARGAGMGLLTNAMDTWIRGSCFLTRIPEFVLGIVLALRMHRESESTDQLLRSARCRLGALAVYLTGTVLSFTWYGMTVAPMLTSAGSFGLLYGLLARGEAAPRRGLLEWVGIHSYSLFLVHHLAIQRLVPENSGPTRQAFVRLAVALVATVLGGLCLEWGVSSVGKGLRRWKEKSGLRGVLAGSGAIVLVLALVLVGAEFWSRRWSRMELMGWGERPSLVPDPELGWHLKPSTTTHLRWESYDYRITSNALGYPGSDVPESRPPGTLRILVTGDAFTSAEGVDTPESWPRLLEARLASLRPSKRFQVLNFAITGYGPNQYAQVVERFVPRFKPDLVIIESFVNDFSDVLTPQEEFVKGIGFEKPDPDGLRSVLTLGNLRTWLKQGVLGPRIARLRGKPDFRGLYFGGIIYLEREPDETEGETKLAERFARIRSVCQGEGARLLVASVPAAAQVCEPTQLPYFPAGVDLSDVSKYDVERPQRILKRIADALKADFVDLRGPLRKSPELPYQPANLHWTRAGHRVVAEHLALLLAEDEELMKRAGD